MSKDNVKAMNKNTGAVLEFTQYQWEMMSHWAVNPWEKIPAKAPAEAEAAAKGKGKGFHEITKPEDIKL